MSGTAAGVYFRATSGVARACDGRVVVYRWRLEVNGPDIVAVLGTALAAAHVPSPMRLLHPHARVATKLAAKCSTVRTGDFGEFLATLLYSERLGEVVPIQKLASKAVYSATQQGTDLLGLTISPGEKPAPVVVEVKARATVRPKEDLEEIAVSLGRTSPHYLESAWTTAVGLMESHPDYRRAYALAAAISLAKLHSPGERGPDHDRHAVIVAPNVPLTVATITKHWGPVPPVSELHIIEVPDMMGKPGREGFMDQVYAHAATLSYAEVDAGVPAFLADQVLQPGVEALLSVSAPQAAAKASAVGIPTLGVIEVALWVLAEWDGMATARALQLAEAAPEAAMTGLAYLLAGQSTRAKQALANGHPLSPLVSAAEQLWSQELTMAGFHAEVEELVGQLPEPELAETVRYVAAAISYRYPRLPALMVKAAGADGPNVSGVIDRVQNKLGRRALWPSQAKALHGGLLDRGHPSLAIKMPTSAGKTMLIELVVADALDCAPAAVAAVVAPTRALVRQLTSDLRRALPRAAVRSSHGGMDFDTEDLSEPGLLGEPGVVVVTPERLDLEWRRAASGETGVSMSNLGLLVVDEAHMLTETRRGARLELLVARALRAGVRVVLLSSQFPTTELMADWLEGRQIESEWGPTWLYRQVYYRSEDNQHGLLVDEAGAVTVALTLVTPSKAADGVCVRTRRHEAAALAERLHADGLVVVYAEQRARMDKLSEAIRERFSRLPPLDDPRLTELIAPLEHTYPDQWQNLRVGVGVHHAHVPVAVRQAVERCARKRLLRCIACTSTLLEGVDFPTRTVICAYPPQDAHGRPQVARLRNLAGRAGRGGLFTSGTLIVMVQAEKDVAKWLKAFRSELPPTRSALHAALAHLRSIPDHLQLAQPDSMLAAVDALILEAAAEGATTEGELRQQLEELLGRTLWHAGTRAALRDIVLQRATQRAEAVQRAVGGDIWKAAFYRTGLPLASCLALRDALADDADRIAALLADAWADHDEVLVWLASHVAPYAPELSQWAALDGAELRDVLSAWLAGVPADTITQAHSEAWATVWEGFETLLPWILTAIVEFVLVQSGTAGIRDAAHARLGISRLRYGVPHAALCDLVRHGADRVQVSRLAEDYDKLDQSDRLGVERTEFVRQALAAAVPAGPQEPF